MKKFAVGMILAGLVATPLTFAQEAPKEAPKTEKKKKAPKKKKDVKKDEAKPAA